MGMPGLKGLRRRAGNRWQSGAQTRRPTQALRIESLEQRRLLTGEPVAHWMADDLRTEVVDGAQVAIWTDAVSGIEATAIGEPRFVDNAIEDRGAVRFNRSDGLDALRVEAAVSPLNGATDFSIVVVFSTDSSLLNGSPSAWFLNTALLDGTDFFGTTADWGLGISSSGQIGAGLGGPATSLYSGASGLNDGQPHIVVYTRSAGTMSLYVDDHPVDIRTGASTAARTAVDMHFGAVSGDSFGLIGQIAEVQIYDEDLSADDVESLILDLRDAYSFFAPTAVDDNYSTLEDTPLQLTAAQGVLSNDINLEPHPLTAQLVELPQHGSLELAADGSLTYEPNPDYFGPDEFTYLANNRADSEIARVTLDIVSVVDRVPATADSYLVQPGATLSVGPLSGLLANDPQS